MVVSDKVRDPVYGRHSASFPYHGITHPVRGEWLHWLWRRLCCSREWHLFDEVSSSDGGWSLDCDACGLVVNIESVDSTYREDGRP